MSHHTAAARVRIHVVAACLAVLALAPAARAQDQTATLSPIAFGGGLPYAIRVSVHDMGSAEVPVLQSYAFGQLGDEWILVAGRTNGLHNFTGDGSQNFPPLYQNTDVWVIDPVTQQTWSRSLTAPSSGLSAAQVDSLSATNTEFVQNGSTLYVAGGYVYDSILDDFTTYDTLTALDLPGVVDWVKNETGTLAENVRQLHNPAFQVTGGTMQQINGRTLLVFGQDFEGGYTPNANGVYTQQVRAFDIVDDGQSLAIFNLVSSTPLPEYRRRDLNVVPYLHSSAPGVYEEGLVALAGVFTLAGGVWTVPVEITAGGTPSMADPNDPGTFKQGMNGYDSPTVSLYRASDDSTHTLVFGGISLQYYDYGTASFVTDENVPFINQSTSIVRATDGAYTQYLLSQAAAFPTLPGPTGPLLFGAGARFLPSSGLPAIGDLVDLDALGGSVVLGQIFGGIMATAGNNGPSTASSYVFDVTLPEPGASGGAFAIATLLALLHWTRARSC